MSEKENNRWDQGTPNSTLDPISVMEWKSVSKNTETKLAKAISNLALAGWEVKSLFKTDTGWTAFLWRLTAVHPVSETVSL
jgi:hypothetical protein